MEPDVASALDTARQLAGAGIPLFIAHPDATTKTGFRPPRAWERTQADPGVVDRWRPGLALCAVMGHGLDLIDVDPRNGADLDALAQVMPRAYGSASTPSGGAHVFVRSLGVGSRDGVLAGIDVKGGTPDGLGRGFAFLAPTVRASAVTGEPTPYVWVAAPDMSTMDADDASGAALAARIRGLRAAAGSNGARSLGGPSWWQAFIAAREPQSAPAAERAIATKLTEVTTWKPDSGSGFRQVVLRAALTLGGYVGGGYLDEADARERLEAAVSEVWGSPDAEDELWIAQGLDDGATHPFWVFTAEDERAYSEAAQAVAREGEHELASDAQPWSVFSVLGADLFDPAADSSDQGLAKAVAFRMYPALRYAKDAGLWVKREREVWEECGGDMSDWIVSLLGELMPLGDPDLPPKKADYTAENRTAARRARFMSAAGAGGISRKLRAVVRSDHPTALRIAELDTNPEVMWAGGTVWDLRASSDGPAPAGWVDPNTPHLRTARCAPADVPTPRWDAFLAAVWPDPEVRVWALRVLSIAFTGHSDKALPIMVGEKDRGKTQVVHLLMSVLGSYGVSADPRLLGGVDNAHASIVYALMGCRLAFVDEGPREGRWAQERLKQLTGGGQLTGNQMRQDPVSFVPTHTLVLTANEPPPLTDPAVRTRVRYIPCDGDVDQVRRTRTAIGDTTGAAWRAEAPGVLGQMIREAGRWLADRNSATTAAAPVHIRDRAELVAAEQDVVGQWITEMCEPYEAGTKAGVLHEQFVTWCRNNGIRDGGRPGSHKWGRRLTELGYPPDHRRDGKYRLLRVTAGGSFGVLPVPPASEGSETRVTLSEGVRDPSVTLSEGKGSQGVLAGQTPYFGGSVTDVTIPLRSTTTTFKNEDHIVQDHINAEIFGETGGLRERVTPTLPNSLSDQGKQGSVTLSPEGSRGRQRVTPTYRLDPTTQRHTKGAQREAEKAEARAAAAGESVGLPVLVDQAGTVVQLHSAEAIVAELHAAVSRSGALTVDVETTGYAPGHADYRLRTVQLGDQHAAVVLDPADPDQAGVIRWAVGEAVRLHAHSATADLVPLVHAGLADEAAWLRMWDTVIPAKLADPASTGSDPGLKQLAGIVLGEDATAPAADKARANLFKVNGWLTDVKLTTPATRSGWAQVDSTCTTMLRYAASDVLDTAALATRLPPLPDALAQRERDVQRITARVTHRGLPIDRDHVAALQAEHEPAMAAAAAVVRALGVDNPGSDRQLVTRLVELDVALPRTAASTRHPDGQPSVAAGVLEGMRDRAGAAGELIRAVLEFRHHETVLSTFLGPYAALCEYGDGRVRPTVYTLGTDTGRMSCVRPNLQQLPREGGVRACITADPGHTLISADFAGVEIRVMAALSQDPTLITMLADGGDLHAMVAAQAFGPQWSKADRYVAKRGVFGWAYGGGTASLARQVGVHESVMGAIVDSLQLVAPGYVEWAAEVKRAVRAGSTAMPTYSGRTIHLQREYPHKAPNFCIQGTARELLVDALLAWDQTSWGGGVVLPVHDEIVAMVPEGDAERATAELVRCMTRELYGVAITAEASRPSFAWRDS